MAVHVALITILNLKELKKDTNVTRNILSSEKQLLTQTKMENHMYSN